MRLIILALILVSGILADECLPSELLVRVFVVTKRYASEQSYRIINGPQVVAESEEFIDNSQELYSHCIPKNVNYVYDLELSDSQGDCWTEGSYIRVSAEAGNYVYQGTHDLLYQKKKVVQFSLFYGFAAGESWKVRNGPVSDNWTFLDFDDSSWTNVNDTAGITTRGTVYARKVFTSRANYAAYELSVKYQYGVIMYVNGMEVQRDFMPKQGVIDFYTNATGHYNTNADRSFHRSGLEVALTTSIVAVEFHYETLSSVDFLMDSYLGLYLPSVLDNCYLSTESYSVSSDASSSNPHRYNLALDEDISTYWDEETAKYFVAFTYTNFRPLLNGFQIRVNYLKELAPSSFIIYGSNDMENYDVLYAKENYKYLSSEYETFKMPGQTTVYRQYKIAVNATMSGKLRIYEFLPLTCSFPVPPNLAYEKDTWNLHRMVENVELIPKYDGFAKCTIDALPPGLVLDETNCIIRGTPTTIQALTKYVITAHVPKVSSTDIYFAVTECTGVVLLTERTYGHYDSSDEAYYITNVRTGDVPIRVDPYTIQESDTKVITKYCLPTGTYQLTMWSVYDDEWYNTSEISLYYYFTFDGSVKKFLTRRHDPLSGWNFEQLFTLSLQATHGDKWYYHLGDLPPDWNTGTDPAQGSWTLGTPGQIPDSPNHIQVYRKMVNLTDFSIGCGYEIEVKHTGGIVMFIGNQEIYRNDLPLGEITNSTKASVEYTEAIFRRVAFPVNKVEKVPSNDGESTVSVVDNTVLTSEYILYVTIVLIAMKEEPAKSVFDCSLEVTELSSYARSFDIISTASQYPDDASFAFDKNRFSYWNSREECDPEHPIYIQISFPEGRKEWISKYFIVINDELSHYPASWVFQGYNSGVEGWVTLDTVTNVYWWQSYQRKDFYVINNTPYNKYRWYDIKSQKHGTNCRVDIVEIGIIADEMKKTLPDLSYGTTSMSGFEGSELSPAYPNSQYYSRYTATPTLPEEIILDHTTGVIFGHKMKFMEPITYTIAAYKPNGEKKTTSVTIDVKVCQSNVIGHQFLTDSYPQEMQWWFRKSFSSSGEVIHQGHGFVNRMSDEFSYFCVDDGQYVVQLYDRYGDGWFYTAAWRAFDEATDFTYAYSQLPEDPHHVSSFRNVTFTVSTPVKLGKGSFKVLKPTTAPANGWNALSFDDSKWETKVGGQLGKYTTVTNYVRLTLDVDTTKTAVVASLMRLSGGAIGYVDGTPFVRVGLASKASHSDKAKERTSDKLISSSVNTQIHLATGKHVMAFEIHQSTVQNNDSENTFDLFVANTLSQKCTHLHTRYDTIKGSQPIDGKIEFLLDERLFDKVSLEGGADTHVEWTYEDLHGFEFNRMRFYSVGENGLATFILYGRLRDQEGWTTVYDVRNVELKDRDYVYLEVPNGVIGFNAYRLVVYEAKSPNFVSLTEVSYDYCPHSGNLCATVDGWPTVAHTQRSCKQCPPQYDGYMYRVCTNGKFGPVMMDECFPLPPVSIQYPKDSVVFYVGITSAPFVPVIVGALEKYVVDPTLPAGVNLNTTDGGIYSTKPTKPLTPTKYHIVGSNSKGSVSTNLTISIVNGVCAADYPWPEADVYSVTKLDCAVLKGSQYYGQLSRACYMGANGPVWDDLISGKCTSKFVVYGAIIGLIVLAALVVISALTVKVRSRGKRSKAEKRKEQRIEKESLLSQEV